MAQHNKPAATGARGRLQAIRTWSITLGIAAFLLTAMYTIAALHHGALHFGNAESVISELARGDGI